MVVLEGLTVSDKRGTPVLTLGGERNLFSLGKRELRNREPPERSEEQGTDIGCEEGVASRLLDTSRL